MGKQCIVVGNLGVVGETSPLHSLTLDLKQEERPSLEESWDVSFEQPSPETCSARDLTFLARTGYCQLLQTDERARTKWVVVDVWRNIPITLIDPGIVSHASSTIAFHGQFQLSTPTTGAGTYSSRISTCKP